MGYQNYGDRFIQDYNSEKIPIRETLKRFKIIDSSSNINRKNLENNYLSLIKNIKKANREIKDNPFIIYS